MNEKFQYRTRPPSAVLKNFEFDCVIPASGRENGESVCLVYLNMWFCG